MLKTSNSALDTLARCRRLYYYKYILKRVPRTVSDALSFGKAAHKALEMLWQRVPLSDVRGWLVGAARDITIQDAYKLAAVFSCYDPPLHELQDIQTEVAFETTVKNPDTKRAIPGVRICGYIDAVATDSDGRRVVIEHKTTSEEILGFGPYWARLANDGQIALYSHAAGGDRVLYNVIRKPQLRVSNADRKAAGEDASELKVLREYGERVKQEVHNNYEQYFQARWIPLTDGDVERSMRSMYQRVKELQHCMRVGAWPMYPHSCRSFYGVCPFLDVCAGRMSVDDDAFFMDKPSREEEEDGE